MCMEVEPDEYDYLVGESILPPRTLYLIKVVLADSLHRCKPTRQLLQESNSSKPQNTCNCILRCLHVHLAIHIVSVVFTVYNLVFVKHHRLSHSAVYIGVRFCKASKYNVYLER